MFVPLNMAFVINDDTAEDLKYSRGGQYSPNFVENVFSHKSNANDTHCYNFRVGEQE